MAPEESLITIEIRDLEAMTMVGVYPTERRRPQPVCVSIELEAAVAAAAASGRVEDTVDYAHLARGVRDLLAHRHYELLEEVAGAVANLCLEDPRVFAVEVRVEKPKALRGGARPAVSLRRSRNTQA